MAGADYPVLVKAAWKAVDQADLPREAAIAAFGQVLQDMLAEMPAAVGEGRPDNLTIKDRGGPLDLLSERIGVSSVVLEDAVSVRDGEIELHFPSAAISSVKKNATRELTLLVTAVRLGAGVDDQWTPVVHIRAALQDYGRYDAANFAENLRAVEPLVNLRGKGASAEVRLTRQGWEQAGALFRTLAGHE